MPKKKKRVVIPRAIEAQVLGASDRTCCVCRQKGKTIQIHHIDDNPANNDPENLAVLCLECHNDTQKRGGFGRQLNADQIILFRDAWLIQVDKSRVAHNELIEQKVVEIVNFRQAIHARDWQQAEKILQKHPDLPGGRSKLGLCMSKEVQEYFSSLLYRYVHPHWPGRRLTESWSLPQLTGDIQKVIQWLEKALNHQDDPEGQVSIALALMYGFNERYEKMMNAVGEVRTNHPALLYAQEMVQVTKAFIFGQGEQAIPRPDYNKEPDPTHPSERAFDLPVDELLQLLFDEFLFLCPCS